jgi:hypothetical protein
MFVMATSCAKVVRLRYAARMRACCNTMVITAFGSFKYTSLHASISALLTVRFMASQYIGFMSELEI